MQSTKRKAMGWLGVLLPIASIIISLARPVQCLDAAWQAVQVWGTQVLPALFPFMVLSSWLMDMSQRRQGGRGRLGWAVCLGMAGGYPAGARILADMVCQGRTTAREAAPLLPAACVCSPAFLLGTVGSILANAQLAAVLLACHLAGGLLTAAGCALWYRRFPFRGRPVQRVAAQAQAQGEGVFGCIRSSLYAALYVGGCMVLFWVVLEQLELLGAVAIVEKGCAWLGLPAQAGVALLRGSVEMTAGVSTAAGLPDTAMAAGVCLLVLGGSGLCVAAQSMGYLRRAGFGWRHYLLPKALQGTVSAALLAAVWPALQCAAGANTAFMTMFEQHLPTPTTCLILLGCMVVLFVYLCALYWLWSKAHGHASE